MKTKLLKKMWESGTIRIFVMIAILGGINYLCHDVKDESSWGDFYCKIEVPKNVFGDSIYWSVDTLKQERHISAWKYPGDTNIRVGFDDFREYAKISLKDTLYKIEVFWWYGLAMDFFPANSGDRWEINLEQEDGKYSIICRRMLITQTYVGGIFSSAFCLGFCVSLLWNGLFPRGKKKDEKVEKEQKVD